MKLVIATPLYPPEIGGPATYAKALEDGLPEKGIETVLVKFGDVRRLPKVLRHIAYYRRVRRALVGADAVLALDPVSVGLPACLAARRAKKPFVVKIVGDYAWEQGRQRFGVAEELDVFIKMKHVPFAVWFLRVIQTGVARRAVRVIVPSDYLKRIVQAWGVQEGSIEVIYNAVSVGERGVAPHAVQELARPLVVTAGRLVPWKGMDGVIDAVAALKARGIRVSLAIVGDGPERALLEALAREKLLDRFVFTGSIAHADMLGVLASADVFVLNSTYEGLSHLLIEARLLEVPTIATRVGGNAEVVREESLVALHDTPGLAEKILTVINNPKHASSEENAISGNRFLPETMISRTAALLTSL